MTRQALLFGVFTVCLLWIHVWMDPDTSERKKSPLNLFLVAVAKSLTSNKAAASIPFHLLNLFCCRCQDFYGCGRVCVASGWIHQRDAMKRHHILFMLPPAMDRKSKLLFKCPSHVFLWEERSSFTPPPDRDEPPAHLVIRTSVPAHPHIAQSSKGKRCLQAAVFHDRDGDCFLSGVIFSSRLFKEVILYNVTHVCIFLVFFPVWSVTFLTAKVKQKLWGRVPEVIKPDDRITPISKIKVPALLEVSSWEL